MPPKRTEAKSGRVKSRRDAPLTKMLRSQQGARDDDHGALHMPIAWEVGGVSPRDVLTTGANVKWTVPGLAFDTSDSAYEALLDAPDDADLAVLSAHRANAVSHAWPDRRDRLVGGKHHSIRAVRRQPGVDLMDMQYVESHVYARKQGSRRRHQTVNFVFPAARGINFRDTIANANLLRTAFETVTISFEPRMQVDDPQNRRFDSSTCTCRITLSDPDNEGEMVTDRVRLTGITFIEKDPDFIERDPDTDEEYDPPRRVEMWINAEHRTHPIRTNIVYNITMNTLEVEELRENDNLLVRYNNDGEWHYILMTVADFITRCPCFNPDANVDNWFLRS